MAKRKKDEAQQLWDGTWYRIDDSYTHICCDCGLAHSVYYKLENGTVFMRWDVDSKGTAAVRRTMKLKHVKQSR